MTRVSPNGSIAGIPRTPVVPLMLVWLIAAGGAWETLSASDYEPYFPQGMQERFGHSPAVTPNSIPMDDLGHSAEPLWPAGIPEHVVTRSSVRSAVWNESIHSPDRKLELQQHFNGNRQGRLFGERPWIVDGPSVPEPMLFDMVRPMNARKGELEMNVLGIVPLHARRAELDWAPEIEYAIADGVAVEFEFPFLDQNLEALKFAVQYTFDVGLNNRLIHGYHGIYEYVFDGQLSELTSLYMVGLQLNEIWSVVGMFGFRSTIESEARSHFTELIQNVSFFANVTDDVIVGVETNMSHHLAGPSTLLIMPQVHWDMTSNLNLQFGIGLQAASDHAVALHAFRVVWEF